MAYDIVIKNGNVIDGSGMPAVRSDVAIKDGKIVARGAGVDGKSCPGGCAGVGKSDDAAV